MSAQPQTFQDQNDWSNIATISDEVRKSRFHYLFVGIDDTAGIGPDCDGYVPGGGIDCAKDAIYTGLRYVVRGRFNLVRNKTYIDPRAPLGEDDKDPGALADPAAFAVGRKQRRNFAEDIATLLVNAHRRPNPGKGLRVISRLTDAYPAVARWVEHVLLSPVYDKGVLERLAWLKRFDVGSIPNAPDDPNWRGWLLATGTNMVDLVLRVRDECVESCQLGEKYMRSYYNEYIAEMRETLVRKEGLSTVEPKLECVAKELGLDTPYNLADQISKAQTQPATLTLPAELVDVFRAILEKSGTPLAAGSTVDVKEFEEFLEFKRAKALSDVHVTTPPETTGHDAWVGSEETAATEVEEVDAAPVEEPASEPERSIAEKTADEEPFEMPARKRRK